MTAKEAAEFVESEVNLSYERDRKKLFKLLTLVNAKAWREGSWWGMNKHFHVKVEKDVNGFSYFIAPNGHNTLQIANFNTKPIMIRDHWFEFHKNGNGSITRECSDFNWVQDITDMGEVPVTVQPREITNGLVKIGVRALGTEKEPVFVNITGENSSEERVLSYSANEDGCTIPNIGAVVAVDKSIRILDNIIWERIDSITKNVSVSPIEIYAVYDGGIKVISRLEPEETESKLRKYLVPDGCPCQSVHGIFKISKPQCITYPSQRMIIDDKEALLSLTISMDMLFNKKTPEESLPYTANGITSLEKDAREHESPSHSPIQVTGIDDQDDILNSNY